ncbi:heme-binding protein 1-like [Rhopilema esculentum]|uniref:heme-binding protein 1-like n=1 Tax=Rhopilema esculentum TaxID=499914 RepID=UPI0031D32DE5|eukprot:gene15144-6332_t
MGVIVSFFSDEGLQDPKKPGDQENKKKSSKNRYILLDYNKVYETRQYKQEFWISRTAEIRTGEDIERTIKRSSVKLKSYLQRQNGKAMNIGETQTTICMVTSENDTVTISMLLPDEYKTDPPQPTDKDVFLHEHCPKLIYAMKLQGPCKESNWARAHNEIKEQLDYNEEAYSVGVHYRVKQFPVGNRWQNEVWFLGPDVDKEYECI